MIVIADNRTVPLVWLWLRRQGDGSVVCKVDKLCIEGRVSKGQAHTLVQAELMYTAGMQEILRYPLLLS